MLQPSDILTLRDLEESLWRRETRFDAKHMAQILVQEFSEFGRSGRNYTRAESLEVEAHDIPAELPLPSFSVQEVTSEVALVTYRSEVQHEDLEVANHSSIWRRKAAAWELVFHQGERAVRTPVRGSGGQRRVGRRSISRRRHNIQCRILGWIGAPAPTRRKYENG